MPVAKTLVHVWRDAEAKKAFVFHGSADEPSRYWNARHEAESQLNDWLRTLAAMPALDADLSALWPTFANRARTVVRHTQKQLKASGYAILSSRDRATIAVGFKKERPIYAWDGLGNRCWFRSVREAADALGLHQSAITLAAQDQKRRDIRYAADVDAEEAAEAMLLEQLLS